MPTQIFLKEKVNHNVKSVHYDSLANELKQYPKGFVGVEAPSGGNLQHYYYQALSAVNGIIEIQRYPLRKLGETYSCMKGYSCLLENQKERETCFDTPQEAPSPPALPEGCLFFTADDRPTIQHIIEAERTDKMKVTEEVPYFPDLALTKAQQEFLYQGPVLKGNIIFQKELSEILNHKKLSIDEKEAILKACISKERIQLSGESEVLARSLQECFLTIGKLVNYPVAILSSKALTEGRETPPSLGAIQLFYIQCIQSHLQIPLEQEALNVFKPISALIPLGHIPATDQIETFKGLSEREESCFNALNVLLMSGAFQYTEQKKIIKSNPRFMDVLDDLIEMFRDIKDALKNNKATTSKPEYEIIYREFFLVHEIDLTSLRQLESLNSTYFVLFIVSTLDKQCAILSRASIEERDEIKSQLRAQQNDPVSEIRKLATDLLVKHQLLNEGEKQALFLESVVKCEMEIVDLLLQQDQNLLLHQGNVTDYSGRKWKNISATQYVNWALDTEMFSLMMKHISLDEEGDKIRVQVKHQVDMSDEHGICYTLNNQNFKEIHYNYKVLTDAYIAYFELKAVSFKFDEVEKLWLLVGAEQRNVPVHVAHHLCNPEEELDRIPDFDKPLPIRSLLFRHYPTFNKKPGCGNMLQIFNEETWFPLSLRAGAILGVDFAIARGNQGSNCRCPVGGCGLDFFRLSGPLSQEAKLDFSAINVLFEVKLKRLASLKEQSLPSTELSCPMSFR